MAARYRGWTKRALKAQYARLEKEITDLQHNAAPGFISIPLTPGAYRIYNGEGKDLGNGSILVTKYMSMSLTGRFLLKDGDEVVIRKGAAEKPTEIPPEQEAWFKNAGAPAIEACPHCGNTEVIRLLKDYEAAPAVPIVGCGNEWHYVFPAPYDNPAFQHHPDDGHKHHTGCILCGVDLPDHFTPVYEGVRAALTGSYPPSTWPAEVLAKAMLPHTFEGSELRCTLRACNQPVHAAVHQTPIGAKMYVESEMSFERPRDSRVPSHQFSGSRTYCEYPGCGASDRAQIHEATPGWPPQDS